MDHPNLSVPKNNQAIELSDRLHASRSGPQAPQPEAQRGPWLRTWEALPFSGLFQFCKPEGGGLKETRPASRRNASSFSFSSWLHSTDTSEASFAQPIVRSSCCETLDAAIVPQIGLPTTTARQPPFNSYTDQYSSRRDYQRMKCVPSYAVLKVYKVVNHVISPLTKGIMCCSKLRHQGVCWHTMQGSNGRQNCCKTLNRRDKCFRQTVSVQ